MKRDEVFDGIKTHIANFPSLTVDKDILGKFINNRYTSAGLQIYGVGIKDYYWEYDVLTVSYKANGLGYIHNNYLYMEFRLALPKSDLAVKEKFITVGHNMIIHLNSFPNMSSDSVTIELKNRLETVGVNEGILRVLSEDNYFTCRKMDLSTDIVHIDRRAYMMNTPIAISCMTADVRRRIMEYII